jgi:peptide/nickel transport system permease protein
VGTYIARRMAMLVLVLFGMSLLTFIISHAIPGDPVRLAAGPHAGPEQIESLRKQLGFDKPLPVQYMKYMSGLLRGDMGISVETRRPVREELMKYLPATVELSIFALAISVLLGLPLGVLSAVRRNSPIDHSGRMVCLLGASTPIFWLGLLLQLLFYKNLGLLPIGGRIGMELNPPTQITGLYILDSILSLDWLALKSSILHIILPAVTLGYGSMAVFTRMTRSSILEILNEDYIRTARAKGLSERIVIYKHALRNAILPVLTLIGLQFASLLGGAVLTETVFSWPGLGNYGVHAIMTLNFPAIMGVTLVITTIFVAVNLVIDISYAFVDPRIVYK